MDCYIKNKPSKLNSSLDVSPITIKCFQFFFALPFRFAKLQELIAMQTDIRANQQLLLFENCLLTQHITQMQKAETYPETTEQNPVYLYKEECSEYPRIQPVDIRKLQQ